MDPNAALAEIRRLLALLAAGQGDTIEEDRAAYDIADHVRALDDWLSAGGFPPAAWPLMSGCTCDAAETGQGHRLGCELVITALRERYAPESEPAVIEVFDDRPASERTGPRRAGEVGQS